MKKNVFWAVIVLLIVTIPVISKSKDSGSEENRFDFYGAMETFLETHLQSDKRTGMTD